MAGQVISRKWPWAVIATFMASVVAAGHGVGPIGLLLVMGWKHWLPHVILGWLAVFVLGVGSVTGAHSSTLLRAGSVLVLLAWVLFQSRSEAFLVSLLFSLPFLACLGGFGVLVWRA